MLCERLIECVTNSCTFVPISDHQAGWMQQVVYQEPISICYACVTHYSIHICRQSTDCFILNNTCVISGKKILHYYYTVNHHNMSDNSYSLEAFSNDIFDHLIELRIVPYDYKKVNSIIQRLYDVYCNHEISTCQSKSITEKHIHQNKKMELILLALQSELLEFDIFKHDLMCGNESKGKNQNIYNYYKTLKKIISGDLLTKNNLPYVKLTTDDKRQNGRLWHIWQKIHKKNVEGHTAK